VQPGTVSSDSRDDFTLVTKRAVALRAGYHCSFTGCGQLTVGPSDESAMAVAGIGVAAHICAAAAGGRRYDPVMSAEERSHIDNAIWLCSNHATLIDRDAALYTADSLRAMKRTHEHDCAQHVRRSPQDGQASADPGVSGTICENTASSLPITVTALQGPMGMFQCGLSTGEYDVPCFYIPDVFISNSSLERTVTLRVSLAIYTKQMGSRRMRREGTGTTWWGGKMGENDAATLALQRHGRTPTAYILSPVTIGPQQTVQGRLAFVFDDVDPRDDFGKRWLIDVLLGTGMGVDDEKATDENKLRYSLEITDVVSGTSVSIPVPGPGYKR
jgi:hypothetical protein